MSTLNVTLASDTTVTTVPAEQVTLAAGTVEIEEIIDTPGENTVEVSLAEVGRVKLTALSDSNYGNPGEWTYDEVVVAATTFLTAGG
jgi:hypothetical protein